MIVEIEQKKFEEEARGAADARCKNETDTPEKPAAPEPVTPEQTPRRKVRWMKTLMDSPNSMCTATTAGDSGDEQEVSVSPKQPVKPKTETVPAPK